MLKKIPIRRSANRENLFLDCDRELIMLSGLCAFALIFSAQDYLATIFGIVLWLLSLYVLRMMAKADPKMRSVYLRHRKYKKYYPPNSTPFRNNARNYL